MTMLYNSVYVKKKKVETSSFCFFQLLNVPEKYLSLKIKKAFLKFKKQKFFSKNQIPQNSKTENPVDRSNPTENFYQCFKYWISLTIIVYSLSLVKRGSNSELFSHHWKYCIAQLRKKWYNESMRLDTDSNSNVEGLLYRFWFLFLSQAHLQVYCILLEVVNETVNKDDWLILWTAQLSPCLWFLCCCRSLSSGDGPVLDHMPWDETKWVNECTPFNHK